MTGLTIERLREIAQDAALEGTRFGDDVERAIDELIVLRQAMGVEPQQWEREVWSDDGGEDRSGGYVPVLLSDAIAAARQREEAERD